MNLSVLAVALRFVVPDGWVDLSPGASEADWDRFPAALRQTAGAQSPFFAAEPAGPAAGALVGVHLQAGALRVTEQSLKEAASWIGDVKEVERSIVDVSGVSCGRLVHRRSLGASPMAFVQWLLPGQDQYAVLTYVVPADQLMKYEKTFDEAAMQTRGLVQHHPRHRVVVRGIAWTALLGIVGLGALLMLRLERVRKRRDHAQTQRDETGGVDEPVRREDAVAAEVTPAKERLHYAPPITDAACIQTEGRAVPPVPRMRRATPTRRLLARFVDVAIAVALFVGCFFASLVFRGLLSVLEFRFLDEPLEVVRGDSNFDLRSFALLFLWQVTMSEGGAGLTVGKRLLGLRVYRRDYARCGFPRALLRNALLPLDLVLSPLVYVVVVLRSRGERLGDTLAGTTVAHVPRGALPEGTGGALALSLAVPTLLLAVAAAIMRYTNY